MSIRAVAATRSQAFVLVVVALLAAIVLSSSVIWDLMMLSHDGALGLDFGAFYAAAVALQNGHDPYSWAQIGATEAHLHAIGDPRGHMAFNSYANPPLFAWAMGPLTSMPARAVYAIWLAAMGAALVASIALLARSYGVRGRGWALLLFALTPAPVICLFLGQQVPLLLLGLAATLLAARNGHCTLAGVALSIGWIKPHLLLPLAVVLVALLGWRAGCRLLIGLLGTSALLGLASWLLTGGALLLAWGRDLVLYGHTMDTRQPDLSSLAGLYLSVVGRPWSSYLAAALVGAWLLFAALLARHARREQLTPADDAWLRLVALALAAWLLAIPYTHPPDLVLLAVALPLLLGRRLEGLGDPLVRLAIGALLIAPEADLLGFRPNFVLSYSVLVPLTILCALRPWAALRANRGSCARSDVVAA